ncbi:MAG: tyrosine-type recombinase/integrase [Arcobacteraceae bacterium]|nr:tyrosine-type recombinase/integrase [Arcobacteraceae bacterium]
MNTMTQPKLFNRGSKLWIRFSMNGENIRKPLNLEDTKPNRKLATTQIIPQMLLKVHTGEFFNNEEKNKIPLIDEYIHKSFLMHKSTRTASTHNDCIGIYKNHIKEHFGHIMLDKLKPSEIKIWQNTLLEKGLSPARIHTIRNVMTLMYKDALEDEIISKNPFTLVRTPRISQTKVYPFSFEEIQKILLVTTGWVKNFIALAFFTGARSGEMIGLKWEDIDFERKQIYIERTIKMGLISSPKTDSSIRSIDILDALLPYLKNQYKITGAKKSYVFLNDNNEHLYDIKRVRNTHWKKALEKAEIEYRTIYQTRHTFATVMIENNEDILWVSNMLGHINSTMTLSKYARYIKRANKDRAIFLQKIA